MVLATALAEATTTDPPARPPAIDERAAVGAVGMTIRGRGAAPAVGSPAAGVEVAERQGRAVGASGDAELVGAVVIVGADLRGSEGPRLGEPAAGGVVASRTAGFAPAQVLVLLVA